MAKDRGLLIDANGELVVANNGLQIGNTLKQNQFLILVSQPGEFKEFPMLGCGIDDMVNDNNIAEWKRSIRDEFAKDGLQVDAVTYVDSKLTINAKYR